MTDPQPLVPQCVGCGYDLAGLGEGIAELTCPECGRIVLPSDVHAVAGGTVAQRLVWMIAPALGGGIFLVFVSLYDGRANAPPSSGIYVVLGALLAWGIASMVITGWQSHKAPPRSLSQRRAKLAFMLVLPVSVVAILLPVYVLRMFD